MTVADIPTPALLLDADLFKANIQRMADHVAHAGKKLRPHAKAHKCVQIARHQMEAGASGVCVATVNEAELMARSGISDLLLTSPIADRAKCERMAALAQKIPHVAVVVDSAQQVELYAGAAHRVDGRLDMLIDLDIGDHRTGIAPGQAALQLAQLILSKPSLAFRGLQAYSVQGSHLQAHEGRAKFSADALGQAQQTKVLLESNGIETVDVTGGSTGTYADDALLPYMTELQAGSYALMDSAYARIGRTEFSHALTVLATVVSANQPDRVTVDAGFKAFATDRSFGPDVQDLEGARFAWAGDEFGYVFLDRIAHPVKLGQRLRFLPPHCDPNVNLYDRIYVCRGNVVEDIWSVMDRYHGS